MNGIFSRRVAIRRLAEIALLLSSLSSIASEAQNAPEPPVDRPASFDMPRQRAQAAATEILRQTGWFPTFGSCGAVRVGPLQGMYSGSDAWKVLMGPACIPPGPTESVDRNKLLAEAQRHPGGHRVFDYNIPAMSRVMALYEISRQTSNPVNPGDKSAVLLGYLSNGTEEEEEIIGPIIGRMSIDAALKIALDSCELFYRWVDDNMVSVEPIQQPPERCLDVNVCNLVGIRLPPSAHVKVIRSRLPSGAQSNELTEHIASHIVTLDREQIEETGTATIPDLLRYVSQSALHRGPGYRASGAQFAELRGFGPEYSLVLINGRRAFGSAADLAASAFDLNAIPLTAVDRIEISADASSLLHGTDAIGGLVNIILRDRVQPAVDVRYAGAHGGGQNLRTSMAVGTQGERSRSALIAEFSHTRELLGRERSRWNNQDYTRFGERWRDYRTRLSDPPNVRTLDGQNLPGLNSSFASLSPDGQTSTLQAHAGQVGLTSLRSFQSIVPDNMRATLAGTGEWLLGKNTVSTELLAVKYENDLQLFPSIIPGYTWGADHPQNPFGVPVILEAALSGWPAQRQHVEAHLLRGVFALDRDLGQWTLSAFAVRSDESAKSWLRNATNPMAIRRALQASDESQALDVYATLGRRSGVPPLVFVDAPVTRTYAGATHIATSLRGPLLALPAGPLAATLGLEHRHEAADFDIRVGAVSRDVTSAFANLRLPIVSPETNIPAVHDARVIFGARRDNYSDADSVVRMQFGLELNDASESVKVRASHSESFHAPTIFDLYSPTFTLLNQVRDPWRNEVTPTIITTGGNRDLRPTTGRSSSFGVSFTGIKDWTLSADYWQIRMRDRISLLTPASLLAVEQSALSERIVRETPSATDVQLGRPGRLTSINTTKANVGRAIARGIDLAAEAEIRTAWGTITPRVSATLTRTFKLSDLPTTTDPLPERAGVASELGTIPAERGVASLTYSRGDWRATVHARAIAAYKDWDPTLGALTGKDVPSSVLWDLNVSKQLDLFQITLGAFNLGNKEPPPAIVGGSTGFDLSQGDLLGRELYLTVTGSF